VGTTKIWAIKDSLSRVLDYASNPKKTVYTDLQKVLHYAEQGSKTASDEETCFVTGVNCNADSAFEEMLSVQQRFGKTGGNVAYHAYQSFKTGEVSREECHQIGVELAKKMWGDEYQVLVATHLNTQTLHNHFVINAVNMWNGKKFDCNEGVYWRFRSLSDELCAEYRLTVIKNPMGKTPRKIYFAEKNGEPTKFNLMRQAIDYAISVSASFKDFRCIMSDQGYEINLNPNRRYWTIRSVNSKKSVRMIRLGEEYGNQEIQRRIYEKSDRSAWQCNREYYAEQKEMRYFQPRRFVFRGSFKKAKKHTGIYALYLHYCYLLGKLPRYHQRQPLSPEMREAWRHLDRISAQVTLLSHKKLNTLEDVSGFINETDSSIREIAVARQKIYNKLRRCDDDDKRTELLSHRDDCTTLLKQLRKEKRIAQTIIEDNPKIKENIHIETQALNKTYGLDAKQKYHTRSYER
jgi:hypothetical protein